MLKFISILRVVRSLKSNDETRKRARGEVKEEQRSFFASNEISVFDCPTFLPLCSQSRRKPENCSRSLTRFISHWFFLRPSLPFHSDILGSSRSHFPYVWCDSCSLALSLHSFVSKLLAICNSYFMWFIAILCYTAIYSTEIGFYNLKLHFRAACVFSTLQHGLTGLDDKSSMQIE